MTRGELLERLTIIAKDCSKPSKKQIKKLIEEIHDDGILDVQCPEEIAEWMGLSRPA